MNDPQASQVHNQGAIAVLDRQETIFTQSITSLRTGLNSVTFYSSLPDGDYAQGRLIVMLALGPDHPPFYSGIFPASAVRQNTSLRIQFSPRQDPPGQTYTLSLRAEGAPFSILGRNEDIYAGGDATLNHSSINADLAFSTTYLFTAHSVLEDLLTLWNWSRLALPLFLVLVLPGWLLLELSGLHRYFGAWENAAIAVAISLAILPILMLWTSELNLPWRTTGMWVVGLIAAGLLVVLLARRRAELKPQLPSQTSLALLLVLILAAGVRVSMVRDMVAPAWIDSVHHALLGQLVAQSGTYPESFAPYFDLDATRYHPGFHASLAALLLLSGEGPDQILLVYGQVLNLLAVLGVYLFASALTGDRRAGVAAALAAGLFSPMPAYYTSWGRYTHLAGLVILPSPIALWFRWLKLKSPVRRDWLLPLFAGLAAGGLFMVHYRVAGFLALFFLVFLVFEFVRLIFTRSLKFNGGRILALAILTGLPAIVLPAPWLFATLERTILPVINMPMPETAIFMGDFTWGYLTAAQGKILIWLAGAGLLLALMQRKPISLLLPAWTALLLVLANLYSLGLPGGSLVNNSSVAITLYLPITALVGYFASQQVALLERCIPRRLNQAIINLDLRALGGCLLILATLGLGVWGGQRLVTVLNPNTYLIRSADLDGIAWVQENIPADAKFLVNPFLWGYGVYAGADGGYWLSSLSGQSTLPAPVLEAMAYSPGSQKRNLLNRQVIALANHPEDLAIFLQNEGIHYVFLGERGGILSPSVLQLSQRFQVIYSQSGVWVFSIK